MQLSEGPAAPRLTFLKPCLGVFRQVKVILGRLFRTSRFSSKPLKRSSREHASTAVFSTRRRAQGCRCRPRDRLSWHARCTRALQLRLLRSAVHRAENAVCVLLSLALHSMPPTSSNSFTHSIALPGWSQPQLEYLNGHVRPSQKWQSTRVRVDAPRSELFGRR